MGEIRDLGRFYLRKYEVDGNNATPENKPDKEDGWKVFDAIDAVETEFRGKIFSLETAVGALGTVIGGLEVSGDTVTKASWPELSVVPVARDGQRGYVEDDPGTHTDPVTGMTVPNQGIYSGVAASSAWQWMSVDDVAAVQAQLSGTLTQIIGRPVDPVTGTALPSNTFLISHPVDFIGEIRRMSFFGLSAGDIVVRVFDGAGNTFTAASSTTITLAAGLNELDADTGEFAAIPVKEGQYIGFFSAGIVPYTTATADGEGWYAGAGNVTSFTDPTISTAQRLQASFGIDSRSIAARLTELEAEEALSETVPQQSVKIPLAAGLQPDLATDWVHMLGYGQSNDLGADQNAITTTPSLYHQTFGVGARMTQPGISGGINPDGGLLKMLVEQNGPGSFGETKCSGFARSFTRRSLAQGVAMPPVWFASVAGKSGTALAGINEASSWYPNLVYHVQAAKDAATAAAKTYEVPFLLFDHGESDQAASTPSATYKAGVASLFDAIKADVAAITAQTKDVIFLATVSPYHILTSNGASLGLLELCDERDDCHFVAPGYRFPVIDQTHLTAAMQYLKGVYYARAARDVANGHIPDRVRWHSCYAVGTTIVATASAPTRLQLNSEIIGMATDYGIKVVDDTGTLTLSGITIGDSYFDPNRGVISEVRFSINRALGANPKFRYALDHLGSGLTFLSGASGNIFDSTDETVVVAGLEHSLAHAAPPAEISVYIAE